MLAGLGLTTSPSSASVARTDPLDDNQAMYVLRCIWRGDVWSADAILGSTPDGSLRASLLRAQRAFLLAAVSGEREAASRAVEALEACTTLCAAVEAPETWSAWAASWVYTTDLSPEAQEAAAIRSGAELMTAVAHGMLQSYVKTPLALRRALAAFAALPKEPSSGPVAAIRDWGLGTFSLLLSLLPRPIAKLLSLTGGSTSIFGSEGPTQELGEELLTRAATCVDGYDHGASWLALCALGAFLMGWGGSLVGSP